jgi:hypothetical protein
VDWSMHALLTSKIIKVSLDVIIGGSLFIQRRRLDTKLIQVTDVLKSRSSLKGQSANMWIIFC